METTKFTLQNSANLLDIFDDNYSFSSKKLFFAYFKMLPNQFKLANMNGKEANKWFLKNYENQIKEHLFFEEPDCKTHYYFLYEDLIVQLTDYKIKLLFRQTKTEIVEKLKSDFAKFKHRKRNLPELQLLTTGFSGLETTRMVISKPKLKIEDNYNDDFLPIHKTILSRLQKKNDKGLVLLHGKPGTGKTSYIRYLICSLKKDVIFLPPNMAASITDPGLMSVMIENPNSIFVIEDAENIIIDRNRSGSSSVSALLNLADGLLSDCLNIQIICSFNTDLSRVDNALMRKGRLIAKYEFNELETHKAQALSDKLGFDTRITEPMTLAAVYNQNDAEFSPVTYRKAVGF